MNKTEILDKVENGSLKNEVPYFEIGDTVDVHCRITEGDKTRVQVFTGTVKLVNDDGSWVGTMRGYVVNGPRTHFW